MWTPIAEELGVSWQSVDTMHWALGKEEMARRACELKSCLEETGNPEENAEMKPESSDSIPGTQQFEGYRVHHLNATRPQVQLPLLVKPKPANVTAGQTTLPRTFNGDLDRSASTIMGKNGEANLTVEGKRQVSPRV